MSWFGHDSFQAQAYNEVTNAPHKATLSHELIAGAAAYEAAKAYEKHVAKNGQPDNHAKAKEIVAGLSGAFIDRIVETKGLDFVDRQKAKHRATEQTHERIEVDYDYNRSSNYGGNNNGGGYGYSNNSTNYEYSSSNNYEYNSGGY